MTDPSSQSQEPADVPVPPPVLPKPDIQDTGKSGPTYGDTNPKKPEGKGGKERSHPTDPYDPLPKRRGCLGFGSCIVTFAVSFLLLLGGLAGVFAFWGPARFVSNGYTVVNLRTENAVVDSAPDKPTVLIGPGKVHYRASLTKVPVAIFAKELVVEGDFYENASLNAVKVTATTKARFAKNLEVNAAEFTDEGLTLKGELTGKVVRNLP